MKIAIIGCGPAGLASALMLSRKGHDIVIFERFATPVPVGSGIILQPTGLAVLREMGLEDRISALGKRIDHMHGASMPGGKTVLDVSYKALGDGFHGLAVHRAALFEVLYEAVKALGLTVHTGVEVLAPDDIRRGPYGPFELLIDASGARSNLQRHALYPTRWRELTYGALWGSFRWPEHGFSDNTLEQRYVGAHTMIGVLPIGRHSAASGDQVAFFWSIKPGQYDEWLGQGLDVWKHKVRSIWPESEAILEQVRDPSQMSLARYGHSTLRCPYGEKIVYLGDSAHSTSPQLGQGANMALLDAWTFAGELESACDIDEAMRRYARIRRWHVRMFQMASIALTPFYQSDSRVLAGIRDLLFHPLSKLPISRRTVAGLVSGMLAGPPKGLLQNWRHEN